MVLLVGRALFVRKIFVRRMFVGRVLLDRRILLIEGCCLSERQCCHCVRFYPNCLDF